MLCWAGHPGTLLAVAVLAFNDRVGKRAWPGALTGKISDAAWMLVVPPVLALALSALPRLRGRRAALLAVALTALTFTAAKSSTAGAELTSRAWSLLTGLPSRTVADRTDLLTLPVLALSWWLWRRSARPRPWRRTLALATVPLAVAAMTATSPAYERAPRLWDDHGRPVLDNGRRWTTEDGGLTWHLDTRSSAGPAPSASPSEREPLAAEGRCLPEEPQVCFRQRDYELPVEISRDGGADWQDEYLPPGVPRPQKSLPPLPWETATAATATATATAAETGTGPTASTGAALVPYPKPAELVLAPVPGGHTVVVHYPSVADLQVRSQDGRWSQVPLPPRQEPKGLESGIGLLLSCALASFVIGLAVAFTGLNARRLRAGPQPGDPDGLRWMLALRQAAPFGWLVGASVFLGRDGGPWLFWLASALLMPLLALLWQRSPYASPGDGNTVAIMAVSVTASCVSLFGAFLGTAGHSWTAACWTGIGFAVAGGALAGLIGWTPRPGLLYPEYPDWEPPSEHDRSDGGADDRSDGGADRRSGG